MNSEPEPTPTPLNTELEAISSSLVSFIKALQEDQKLREWYCGLGKLPVNLRFSELGWACKSISDKNLKAILKLSHDPELYNHIVEALWDSESK